MTFLTELILIKQVHQKRVIFLAIGMFLGKRFKFQPDVWNGCYDVLMMSVELTDITITILNIQCFDYLCIINGISKSPVNAVHLL